MTRLPLALGLLLAACHHAKPTTAVPEAPTGSAPTKATLDPDIVAIATKPGVATKFKIRVDGTGAVMKQALYHGDAEAIPAEIRTKAEARWAGSKAARFETEWYAEHGRVHEVEVTLPDGKTCELAVKADGNELYEECHVDAASLPAPVTAKVEELFPGGKVVEAETKKGPAMDEITIEVELGGQEFYLRCKPDGTVIAKLARIPAVFEVPIP
jgi:hypothetical protein